MNRLPEDRDSEEISPEEHEATVFELRIAATQILAEAPPGLTKDQATLGTWILLSNRIPGCNQDPEALQGLKLIVEQVVDLLYDTYEKFHKGEISRDSLGGMAGVSGPPENN